MSVTSSSCKKATPGKSGGKKTAWKSKKTPQRMVLDVTSVVNPHTVLEEAVDGMQLTGDAYIAPLAEATHPLPRKHGSYSGDANTNSETSRCRRRSRRNRDSVRRQRHHATSKHRRS